MARDPFLDAEESETNLEILTPEMLETIRARVNDEAATWVGKELSSTVKRMMNEIVGHLLGLKREFGSHHPDADSKERLWNMLDKRVQERATVYLSRAMDLALDKLEADKYWMPRMVDKLVGEIKQECERRHYKTVQAVAEEYGKQVSKALERGAVAQPRKPLLNVEVENPISHEGRLGKLVLAQLAKEMVAQQKQKKPR